WLATNILQVGQASLCSTAEYISELYFRRQITQIMNAPVFGVIIDESTRGQTKNVVLCYQFWSNENQLLIAMVAQLQNVIKCNAEVISDIVATHIQKNGLDVKKCKL
ncbi:9560_t:CDS:2, partial [Cetraspora pellucida]